MSHVPAIRPAPDRLRTARPDPHRPGTRRTPAPAPVASRARPRLAQERRGPAGRGMDGRSRRGRVGRLGGQREPLAALGCGPRAGRGAGEAQLLQRAQSTPPAGQARETLRMLARARVARGLRPASATDGAPRTKKRTDVLATGATGLSAGVAGGGLRDPDGSGAGPL